MPLLLRENVKCLLILGMWSDGSHLLGCNMRGQAWPRHSPSSADLSGRLKSSHPFAIHLCCASCTSPRGLTSCFQVPTYIHADVPPGWRMSLFFSKRNVSFIQFPCHLFVFLNCSSFQAPCLCSSCLCLGYLWKLGNKEEGWNLGKLTALWV